MRLFDLAVATKLAGSGGGGGGGDFTTATVTVINNTGDETSFTGTPNCVEANAMGEGSPACIWQSVYPVNTGSNTVTVPLYKGTCIWDGDGINGSYTYSGNIDEMGTLLVITGDGTITVS